MSITIKSTLKDITTDNKGNVTISFSVKGVNKERFDKLSSEIHQLNDSAKNGLKLSIEKFRVKRTLTQNDTLWLLCEELAKVLNSTKEEIYKKYILELGKFETVPIKNDAVEFFIKVWEKNGIGFQCVNVRDSKLKGYKNIDCYYGSSVYNTKEMARLLDEVIKDCKENNINWKPYIDR